MTNRRVSVWAIQHSTRPTPGRPWEGMSTIEAKDLTWETLVRLEPKLVDLLERVKNTELEPGESAACFFTYAVKPRIERLVGPNRKQGPAILQSSDAYSVAIDTFWAAPPYDYEYDVDAYLVRQQLVNYFSMTGATATEWRLACAEQGISQSRFYRARKALLSLGRVAQTAPGERGNLFVPR